MRILIVVRKLTMGGLQKQALTFAQTAAKKGHDVHLMILKSEKTENELKIPAGITVHRPDFHSRLFKSLSGILNYLSGHMLKPLIFKKIKDFNTGYEYSRYFAEYIEELERRHGGFDMIFLRGQGCFEYFHQFNRERCYCYIDGKPFHYQGFRSDKINRILYGFPKKFICVSEQLKKALLDIEPEAQAICSHNFLDFEEIRRLSGEITDPLPERYIVNVGRLTEVKSQDFLIRIMPKLPDDIKLLLVGDGKFKLRLKQIAEQYNCSDRVVFLGKRDNPYPYIKNAKVLVHTSQKEGFGLIFLEALILNTPIVATESIGGMRDIMKGEILSQQIVPRDPELLAEKIVETIKAPYQSSDVFYREYEASTAFDKLLSRLESF